MELTTKQVLEKWEVIREEVLKRINENKKWNEDIEKVLELRKKSFLEIKKEETDLIFGVTGGFSDSKRSKTITDFQIRKECLEILLDDKLKYNEKIVEVNKIFQSKGNIQDTQKAIILKALLSTNNFYISIIGKNSIERVLRFFEIERKVDYFNEEFNEILNDLSFISKTISEKETLNRTQEIKLLWRIDEEIEKDNKEQNFKKMEKNKIDETKEKNKNLLEKKKQIILYGPAGTGKTYSTKQIIYNHMKNKEDLFEKEDKGNFEENYNDLKDKGRVEFITFHQSFAYEEFIEGIKPDLENESEELKYEIKNGIFKEICERIKQDTLKQVNKLGRPYNDIDKSIEELKTEILEKEEIEMKTKNGKVFIVKYRNGKTFRISPLETKNSEKDYPSNIEDIKKLYLGEKSIKEIYNPSYAQGILNYLIGNEYWGENENKSLKKYNELTKKDFLENSKPYYLIIDEINRGNISKIFGELITLLESSKRLGKDDELKTKLPYSNEEFGVPPNLYIIGTMNTSDKSLTSLDIALRRRFGFIEMLPKYKEELEDLISEDCSKILKELNERIEILLDKDHLIGHSFFMNKEEKELEDIFRFEIVPLLEEYFYNDYEKIQLVLGNKNLEKIKNDKGNKLGDDEKDIYRYWFEKENNNSFDENLGDSNKKEDNDENEE